MISVIGLFEHFISIRLIQYFIKCETLDEFFFSNFQLNLDQVYQKEGFWYLGWNL